MFARRIPSALYVDFNNIVAKIVGGGFGDASAAWLAWLEDGQFKALLEMATDPVCGMAVEREKAISAVLNGQTFFFCSRGCRNEFVEGHQAIPSTTLKG